MIEKIKKNYFLLIATFLLLYFFFNLLDGERGLISYFSKNSQLIEFEKQEIRLKKKIEDLEFKNSLLSDNLDLDYVEILIREKFLFGKQGDTIYIIKNNDN